MCDDATVSLTLRLMALPGNCSIAINIILSNYNYAPYRYSELSIHIYENIYIMYLVLGTVMCVFFQLCVSCPKWYLYDVIYEYTTSLQYCTTIALYSA